MEAKVKTILLMRKIMSEVSPWTSLKVPTTGYTVKKVPDTGVFGVYRAKDPNGHLLLLFEMKDGLGSIFKKNRVAVRGFTTDLQRIDGKVYIVLMLEDSVNRDLFDGLSQVLISAVKKVAEAEARLVLVFNHLKRWQVFLSKQGRKILSRSPIIGLFCELLFLRELVDNNVPLAKAVNSWTGPDRSHHDYLINDTAFEIKALSGLERNSVCISSEDQLDFSGNRLFLKTYQIRESGDSSAGESLNDAVDAVIKDLSEDSAALTVFEAKIMEAGYVKLDDYSEPHWTVIATDTYLVANGFPRVIRSNLPPGVMNISYEIALENLESFKAAESDVRDAIDG